MSEDTIVRLIGFVLVLFPAIRFGLAYFPDFAEGVTITFKGRLGAAAASFFTAVIVIFLPQLPPSLDWVRWVALGLYVVLGGVLIYMHRRSQRTQADEGQSSFEADGWTKAAWACLAFGWFLMSFPAFVIRIVSRLIH